MLISRFILMITIHIVYCEKPIRIFKKGDVQIYSNDKRQSLIRIRINETNHKSNEIFEDVKTSEESEDVLQISSLFEYDVTNQGKHDIHKRNVLEINTKIGNGSEIKFRPWGDWGPCQASSCGTMGLRKRTRTCYTEISRTTPTCDYESLVDFQTCEGPACPPQTTATAEKALIEVWALWTDCSVSCGVGGIQTRTKICYIQGSNGDTTKTDCDPPMQEVRPCQYSVSCPYWGEWGGWSSCSHTCGGGGEEKRERKCIVDVLISFMYVTNALDKTPTPKPSTVPILTENVTLLTSATAFKLSSVRPGTITRISNEESMFLNDEHIAVIVKNHMLPQLPISNTATPKYHDIKETTETINPILCGTTESFVNTRRCDTGANCQVEWGEWEPWSRCSVTCGSGLSRTQRTCIGETRDNTCTGKRYNYRRCFSPPCWSKWTTFTRCSKTCGGEGFQLRTRECMGATMHVPGYDACVGNRREVINCSDILCTNNWEEWSAFGACSASCGGGYKRRTRTCRNGLTCVGDRESVEECNRKECPRWSKWTPYSCCSVNCGMGTRTRERSCLNGHVGEEGCIGDARARVPCYMKPCTQAKKNIMDSFKCGIKDLSSLKIANIKIFGGQNTEANEWPWQVSAQHLNRANSEWLHFCGATLIAPRWVVSAAHCTEESEYTIDHEDPGPDWSVVVGMVTLNRDGFRHYMERVIVHPNYEYSAVTDNDIELIKLVEEVSFSNHIAPACLPQRTYAKPGEKCFITGWGYTESFTEVLSNDLLEASIPIMKFSECVNLGSYYKYFLKEKLHMCAGYPRTARSDSCTGDSGGPLVCLNKKKTWYIAGVTSFAFDVCGTPGHVGIYAPLTTYERWIVRTIEKYNYDTC